VPEAGVAGQTLEELEARLRKAEVVFNLVLQLAKGGDPTDDPAAPWPDDSLRLGIGRLGLGRPTTVEEISGPVMLHNPTRLTNAMEASDRPSWPCAVAYLKSRLPIAQVA
jgi:catalase